MKLYSVIAKVKKFFVHDRWHIGIMQCESAKKIRTWETPRAVSWLPLAQGCYRADPFIISYNGRTALFYEEYIYADDKGHLACRDVIKNEDGTITFGDAHVIDGPRSHRSYPFVFEDGGELWMVPEESACGNVMLYRCTTFPHEWEPVQELIADFPGVDPTLFKYNDLYWLFMTRRDDPNKKLYIFWAEHLTGPWIKHKKAPFYENDMTVRPAGTPFVINNTLYRPAQDSRRTYGGSVVIYQIDTLTKHSFREHRVHTIEPWLPSMRGLHTVSYDPASHLCAFDTKTRACLNDVLAKIVAKIIMHIRHRYTPANFM